MAESSKHGLGAWGIRCDCRRARPLFAVDRRRYHTIAGAHHSVGAPRQCGDLDARTDESVRVVPAADSFACVRGTLRRLGDSVARMVSLQECERAMGAQHSFVYGIVL